MRRYWKLADDVIRDAEIILEVVDARMPNITRNRKIEARIIYSGKPFIIVLNKSDLITESMKRRIAEQFEKAMFVFVSCRDRSGFYKLTKMIQAIVGEKKVTYVGVIGFPNTGKSSVINSLAGRKKARTSPVAGFTKGIQWVRGKLFALYDTPGVVPIQDIDEADRAVMSIISPSQIKDPESAASKIIEMFLTENKKAFENFYKIKIDEEGVDIILDMLGKKMNYILKGERIDVTRTSIRIITDWQKGKLLLNY